MIIGREDFTNVKLIPCDEYKYSFYANIEHRH
jgi:hypothetical protein